MKIYADIGESKVIIKLESNGTWVKTTMSPDYARRVADMIYVIANQLEPRQLSDTSPNYDFSDLGDPDE